MKVVPITGSNGAQTSVNQTEGRSASVDKVARAKAAAAGSDPNKVETSNDSPRSALASPRSIKMKTQSTPAPRDYIPEAAVEATAVQNAAVSDTSESTLAVTEVTKPLDPQIAAFQKRERAVQVKEAAVTKREEALAEKEKSGTTLETAIQAEVESDPLGFLFKRGWDFARLTEQVKRSTEGMGPALTKVETELRKEIKGLKESLETKDKVQAESEEAAYQQSLTQIQKDADKLIASDDAYQMIRETGSNKEVTKLIKRIFDQDGEILDVTEALNLVEADLIEQGLKFAKIPKVQKTLTPEQVQQTQTAQYPAQNTRVMRTLTNRDSASSVPTAKERAIAAFHNRKLV